MAFKSGKAGRVTIAAATLKVTNWSATLKRQKHDVTNSESGGYGEYIDGIWDLDVTIKANFNSTEAPLPAFVSMTTFGTTCAFELFVDSAVGLAAGKLAGTLFVESIRYSTDTRGVVTAEITGSTTGTITASNV